MSTPQNPLFLGLDLSTQSLKGILVDEHSNVVNEFSLNFDKDLPQYGTQNGAIFGPDTGEVTSPVEMFVESIDVLMQKMQDANVDLQSIAAVSGAGQQHGSVYWSNSAEQLLSSLDVNQSLASQLAPSAFSIPFAPIWQDSSTTRECRELEEAIGGPQALADLTGSRAYERFTGPQISRIRRVNPEAYAATSRVSLISSFIPSLFLGKFAPTEISDASGTNLMNVVTGKWDDALLEACGGPELRAKIGPEPASGGTSLGSVTSWWVEKWGFSPDCIVAPFTGDNPASVVALSVPGDAILSLGTSTTLLLSIPPAPTSPTRFTTSHLLAHPTTEGASIAMLCYKNGALARESVRGRYANGHWHQFNDLVEASPVGNNGYLGLYFPLHEIIPTNVFGEFFFKDGKRVDSFPDEAHPRAILESQFLSIRSRITEILPKGSEPLKRLVVTGGSSCNDTILQIAADIFKMKVYIAKDVKESAGTGGAMLAKFAWAHAKTGASFADMVARDPDRLTLVAEPKADAEAVYTSLVERYRECEDEVVRICAVAA